MHSAVDTAYRMLQQAEEIGYSLSNLQLQKLVYIAHGYYLGVKGKPLISDEIQAWKYGPVIPEVYHSFKDNGRGKIPLQGVDALEFDPQFTEEEDSCIKAVLGMYGSDSGEELISITHQDGTPWDISWSKSKGSPFTTIPDEVIKNYYRGVVTSPNSVTGL